ncbi:hypothetical protein [Nannocystis pusilla]|uniref:hypothetical protein n=1 Tax=Nannocystis pusilla TaxID=889268 RepID=UPI003B7AC5A9
MIVDVAMPNVVKVVGPVGFTVTTENMTTVRAKLDGVELALLAAETNSRCAWRCGRRCTGSGRSAAR